MEDKTNQKLNDEQVLSMLAIIAAKYGATLHGIHDTDGKKWIDADCPEEQKLNFTVEAAEFLQNIAA